MRIEVMYFGMLAEITGQTREFWETTENLTVAAFRSQVVGKYPMLEHKKFKIAVNKRIAEDTALIPEQGELALLPPFAGG